MNEVKSIIKELNSQKAVDKQVPEFGNVNLDEMRWLGESYLHGMEVFENVGPQLFQTAMERVAYAGRLQSERPPMHFPNGEHFQHYAFSEEVWNQYPRIDCELDRVNFMIENYSRRRMPAAFEENLMKIKNQDRVLSAWGENEGAIKKVAKGIYLNIRDEMNDRKQYVNGLQNSPKFGAHVSEPIYYESLGNVELQFEIWDRALDELSEELLKGNEENIKSFLSLYAHMKDPITPILGNIEKQVANFNKIINQFDLNEVDKENRPYLIVQAAQEASFMSLPDYENIQYVRYHNHHELPIGYFNLFDLPRGEFANPERVFDVLKEILKDSEENNFPGITPITVSYFEQNGDGIKPFIVDGNNRATAILLANYLAEHDFQIDEENLEQFIQKHDLDPEWQRDLAAILEYCMDDLDRIKILEDNKNWINELAGCKIPALIVQEANFLTVAVSESNKYKIEIMPTFLQSIYNQQDNYLAILAKMQSHGRTEGLNGLILSLMKMYDNSF